MRACTSFLILGLCSLSIHAEDWPHWHGSRRDDISKESSGWSEGAWPLKKPLWTASVHEGCTSPLVHQGRLYSMGWSGGHDHVHCLDAKTGKSIWVQKYRAPSYGRHSMGDKGVYSGPSSTPELDPETGMLYTLGLDGDLNCWNTKEQGKKVWSVNLYDRYKAEMRPQVGKSGRRDYGYTTAPLLFGAQLLVEVGSSQGNLIALDKKTGKHLWGSQAKDPAGHNGGPLLMTVEGKPCVAVLHHNGLLVARLDKGHEGETVATYPWRTEWANNIAGPAVKDNFVLITSEYNMKKMCKLEITLKGARKVWEAPQCSKACTPVIHNGHVYWSWDSVHCLDFKTGKQVWRVRASTSDPGSCIVTSDDRLIVWCRKGRAMLLETALRAPKEGKILSQQDGITRSDAWPHAVVAEGRLYLKDRDGRIFCYSLGKP